MRTNLWIVLWVCALSIPAYSQTDNFAGRTTSPGPDVASSKENVPEKKESLPSKIERYKSEGFKIAVVLSSEDIACEAPSPSSTSTAAVIIKLDGSFPSVRNDLTSLAEDLTTKMNAEFSTDIFELVDMNKIPYKETKFGKVDDWGATKYKMVLTYSATPVYSYSSFAGKYEGRMYVNLNVTGTEFVNEKGKLKMKYPIRSGNLGAYSTERTNWDSDPGLTNLSELKDIIQPPMGADLLAELKSQHDANMDTFIEKCKK